MNKERSFDQLFEENNDEKIKSYLNKYGISFDDLSSDDISNLDDVDQDNIEQFIANLASKRKEIRHPNFDTGYSLNEINSDFYDTVVDYLEDILLDRNTAESEARVNAPFIYDLEDSKDPMYIANAIINGKVPLHYTEQTEDFTDDDMFENIQKNKKIEFNTIVDPNTWYILSEANGDIIKAHLVDIDNNNKDLYEFKYSELNKVAVEQYRPKRKIKESNDPERQEILDKVMEINNQLQGDSKWDSKVEEIFDYYEVDSFADLYDEYAEEVHTLITIGDNILNSKNEDDDSVDEQDTEQVSDNAYDTYTESIKDIEDIDNKDYKSIDLVRRSVNKFSPSDNKQKSMNEGVDFVGGHKGSPKDVMGDDEEALRAMIRKEILDTLDDVDEEKISFSKDHKKAVETNDDGAVTVYTDQEAEEKAKENNLTEYNQVLSKDEIDNIYKEYPEINDPEYSGWYPLYNTTSLLFLPDDTKYKIVFDDANDTEHWFTLDNNYTDIKEGFDRFLKDMTGSSDDNSWVPEKKREYPIFEINKEQSNKLFVPYDNKDSVFFFNPVRLYNAIVASHDDSEKARQMYIDVKNYSTRKVIYCKGLGNGKWQPQVGE